MTERDEMVTQELLPCPMMAIGWCSGGNIIQYEGDSRSPAFVRCDECGTRKSAPTLDAARKAWNTRQSAAALRPVGEVGELVERLRCRELMHRSDGEPVTGACIADIDAVDQAIERLESMAFRTSLIGRLIAAEAEAAATIARLTAEREGMREALRIIAEGDEPRPVGKVWRNDGSASKNDKCIHDRWMYEDCGQCVAEVARAALSKDAASAACSPASGGGLDIGS